MRTMMNRMAGAAAAVAVLLSAGPAPQALARANAVRAQSGAANVIGAPAGQIGGEALSGDVGLAGQALTLAPAVPSLQLPAAETAAQAASLPAAAGAVRQDEVSIQRDAAEASPATAVGKADVTNGPSQESRDELADLRDAVGSLPDMTRASAGAAHGSGVQLQDLTTRTRSFSAKASDVLASAAPSPFSSGLRPARAVPARGEAAAPDKIGFAPAASSSRRGFPLGSRTVALVGAVAASVLIALTFLGFATGIPAIAVSGTLLLMAGTATDKSKDGGKDDATRAFLEGLEGGAGAQAGPNEAAVEAAVMAVLNDAPAAPAADPTIQADVLKAKARIEAIEAEVGKVIVGQQETVASVTDVLIMREHALLESVPGLAKTLLAETFTRVIGDATYNRIQGAADLLPKDITGVDILQENLDTGRKEWQTLLGPIFANIVVADEVNRTPPKTNGIMLSAMQERRVTIGRTQHSLPDPFTVLATQNPIEQEGTYRLPEAQLDRFIYKVILPSPPADDLVEITERHRSGAKIPVEVKASLADIKEMNALIHKIRIDRDLLFFMARVIDATHRPAAYGLSELEPYIGQGSSPRGMLGLTRGSSLQAVRAGRDHVLPEDIRAVAYRVLRHRIELTHEADAAKVTAEQIIDRILDTIQIGASGAAAPVAGAPSALPTAAAPAARPKRWWQFWRR